MRKIFVCITLLLTELLLAQSSIKIKSLPNYRENFDEANFQMEEEHLPFVALEYFKAAYKYDSTNANVNFHIGDIYLIHPSQKHLAEKYLEVAVKNVSMRYHDFDPKEKHAPPTAYLNLGKAYHLDYKFDEALAMYDKYEALLDKSDLANIGMLEHYKEQVRYAKQYVAQPKTIKVTNLGDSINSEYPDFSPVLSADEKTILFTHRGPVLASDEVAREDGWIFENVLISRKLDNTFPGTWTKPKSVSSLVNTGNKHEGSVALTPDGQVLSVYRNDGVDGNLYYSKWNGNDWTSLSKYGSDINSKHWEPSACLSNDGQTLYFVSDRPTGRGGRDIYRCKKLPNGNWGASVPMLSINTIYDEESPFLSPDGSVLYFSSKGHQSMGGFDIMYCTINEKGELSTPINLGYPVNTPDDDLYFVVSPDGKRGYYASSHEGGFGEKDIYMLEIDLPKTQSLVLFKGKVIPSNCDSLPQEISINIFKKDNGELFGTYKPQALSGTFTTILEPNKEYELVYYYNDKEIKKEDLKTDNSMTYQEIERELYLKPVYVYDTTLMAKNLGEVKLQLTIINKKTNKPISNQKLSLISSNNTKQNLVTNVFGKTETINVAPNQSIKIESESIEDIVLETNNINIYCAKKGDTIKEIIYYTQEKEFTLSNDGKKASYKYFFRYNHNNVDVNAEQFQSFLTKLNEIKNKNGKIKISIVSSASEVPTKSFANNKTLAKSRIVETKKKVLEALKKYNINATEVIFVSERAMVSGPKYNKDFEERKAEYEKYQFIEIIAE